MRGDRLQLTTAGAWVALGTVLVTGSVLLPKTQTWVDSGPGLQAIGPHLKFARAEPRVASVLARAGPAGCSTTAGLGVPAPVLPRCWMKGLQEAAVTGRSYWSPTPPSCWWSGRRRPGEVLQARHVPRRNTLLPDGRQLEYAAAHPDEVRSAALKLFQDVRDADYDSFLRSARAEKGKDAPLEHPAVTLSKEPDLRNWSCHIFTGSPIVSIEVGDALIDDENRPTVPYRLRLSDGGVLAGNLVFERIDCGRGPRWVPVGGVDWALHLKVA